jgi:uncharacterized protein DUF4031
MTVYVDDANIPFRGMIMSHLWADTLPELLAMVDAIGVQRKWLQRPPKASWVHFDISFGKKKLAIARGTVLTDKYGPVEHEARRKGDQAKLDQIASIRAKREPAPLVDRTEPRQQEIVL